VRADYDVVVVGAGPAGCVAAWHAAKGGAKVLLLEKDRDIGSPVRCAEGVGDEGLRLIVDPHPSWIQNRIEGVNLIAPNGTSVHVADPGFGYILNRKVFDHFLAEQAARAGADIRTKAYVDGLILEDGFVRGVTVAHLGRSLKVRAKVVIGADGVESRVGRWAGLQTHLKLRDIETCVQVTLANIDIDPRYCDLYFSRKRAPGGYLWVFPKGDSVANVGLGISGEYARYRSPLRYLEDFLQWRFPKGAILSTAIGGVPVAAPLKKMVTDGLMLVGDAAHQANPISGGGIVTGMIAGRIAGRVAAEAVQEGDYSEKRLAKYQKEWDKEEGHKLRRLYRVKEAIYKLSDETLNRTAEALIKLPPEKRTLVAIFKAALFNQPRILLDVLAVLRE